MDKKSTNSKIYDTYSNEIRDPKKEVDNIAKKLEVLDGTKVDYRKMSSVAKDLKNFITDFKEAIDKHDKNKIMLICCDLESALLAFKSNEWGYYADELGICKGDDNPQKQSMSIDVKVMLKALVDYASSKGVEVQFHITSIALCPKQVIEDIMSISGQKTVYHDYHDLKTLKMRSVKYSKDNNGIVKAEEDVKSTEIIEQFSVGEDYKKKPSILQTKKRVEDYQDKVGTKKKVGAIYLMDNNKCYDKNTDEITEELTQKNKN